MGATGATDGRRLSTLPLLAHQSEIEARSQRRDGFRGHFVLVLLTRWLRVLRRVNLPSFEIAVFAALALLAAANF